MTLDKDIKTFCKNRGTFSIPLIQIEFSVTYKEAARIVDELVGTGEVSPLSDELSYEYVGKERVVLANGRKADDISSESESGDVDSKYMEFRKRHIKERNDEIKRAESDEDEDDEDDEETMNRRRRECLERRRRELIAQLQEDMDEDKDEDDGEDNNLFDDDEDNEGEEQDGDDGETIQSQLIEILTNESEYGKLLARALKLCASEGNISERMLANYLNIHESTANELCFWLYLNDFIEQDENKCGYRLAVPEALFYSCCIEAKERKEQVGTLVDVLKRITTQKQIEEEDSKFKALILSDISLNRAKTIVKAQGCLMAVQDMNNDIYVSIYKNIIYKLSNMSDYTFNKLKKQLSG